jgi:hypothetical protein
MEFNYGKSKSYSRNCQRTLLNVGFTTFIESSHLCTIPPIQPHRHLMLVEAPFPCGFGAGRVTVGSLAVGI